MTVGTDEAVGRSHRFSNADLWLSRLGVKVKTHLKTIELIEERSPWLPLEP
jgi:hypothetical protein